MRVGAVVVSDESHPPDSARIATGDLATGCHEQSDSVSLDEIIERNTDAMGGRGAIEAVQSSRRKFALMRSSNRAS